MQDPERCFNLARGVYWRDISDVGTLDSLTYGFVGARNITSLALDSQGNPWIAYTDEKELKLARWDGSAWESAVVVVAGTQPLGQLVSLKLDSQDQPHMAYFEVEDKSPLTGRVKYAKGVRRLPAAPVGCRPGARGGHQG